MCGCEAGFLCPRCTGTVADPRWLLEEDEGFELKVAANTRASAVDFKQPARSKDA